MTRERHTVPLHPCARCGFAFSSEDRGRTRGELRKRLPLAHPRLCRLLGVCMCIAAIRSLPCTRDVRGRVPVRLGEQGVVDRGIRCGFARTETLEEVAKGRVVREGAHRHHRVEGSELPATLPRRHMRPAGPGNLGGVCVWQVLKTDKTIVSDFVFAALLTRHPFYSCTAVGIILLLVCPPQFETALCSSYIRCHQITHSVTIPGHPTKHEAQNFKITRPPVPSFAPVSNKGPGAYHRSYLSM